MATYQKYTYVDHETFMNDLHTFVLANGWTVNFFDVYDTGRKRLHLSNGSVHYDTYSPSANDIYIYGCTGYNAAHAGWEQPGSSPDGPRIDGLPDTPGRKYMFIANGWTIYIGREFSYISSPNYWEWFSFGTITDKIGTWTGGSFVCAKAQYLFTPIM
jgi:hypothetical protein